MLWGKPKAGRRWSRYARSWGSVRRRSTLGGKSTPGWGVGAAGTAAVAGGELEAEAVGGRSDAGQAYAAGRAIKKKLKPGRRHKNNPVPERAIVRCKNGIYENGDAYNVCKDTRGR